MLENVLREDPEHCANLRWRGDLHRYMAEDEQAEKIYEHAMRVHKRHV